MNDIDTTLDVSRLSTGKRPVDDQENENQPKTKKLVLNRNVSVTNETHTNGSSENVKISEEKNELSEEKKVIKLSELGAKEVSKLFILL